MNKQKPQEKQNAGDAGKSSGVQGEGNYTGTRRYNENLAKHLETHDVEQEAEEAKTALEGSERAELEEAERRGKQGPSKQPSKQQQGTKR